MSDKSAKKSGWTSKTVLALALGSGLTGEIIGTAIQKDIDSNHQIPTPQNRPPIQNDPPIETGPLRSDAKLSWVQKQDAKNSADIAPQTSDGIF